MQSAAEPPRDKKILEYEQFLNDRLKAMSLAPKKLDTFLYIAVLFLFHCCTRSSP